jgi:hypothetical protein
MANLPVFHTEDKDFQLMQSRWSSVLNPVLANPVTNPLILKGVALAAGNNVINHKLGQTLQGWQIVDLTSAAVIFRSAPKNHLTLTLNSSVATVADILVF